ncbi:hypothetical protein ABFV05_011897 [Capra hircus]
MINAKGSVTLLLQLARLQKYPKIHVSTGEESSGSGTGSTLDLRPRHRRERNPERPPSNSHGDWPFLTPPQRVPEDPVKYPKIHVSTGEESSGSGTGSTLDLRPRHRRERNPERPPSNSHGDWPFLTPPQRVPEDPVKYPKIHVSTGEESSGSGTGSTLDLRPRHRRERNPERPPSNSHGDWPFLTPPQRVPEDPVKYPKIHVSTGEESSGSGTGSTQGSFTPLLQLKKFPDKPVSTREEAREFRPHPEEPRFRLLARGSFTPLLQLKKFPDKPVSTREEAREFRPHPEEPRFRLLARGSFTPLLQLKKFPDKPVSTREEAREFRPHPEEPRFRLLARGSFTPLLQLKKFPDKPVSTREEAREFRPHPEEPRFRLLARGSFTPLLQLKKFPDKPVSTREEAREFRPHPEEPRFRLLARGSFTPLLQLKKFPDIPVSTREEARVSHPHPEEPCFRLIAREH